VANVQGGREAVWELAFWKLAFWKLAFSEESRMRALGMTIGILSMLAGTASAQRPTPAADVPVIVTAGEGVVKITPDRVWISIAAESRAANARDAQRANADAMTAVLGKLKGAGLPAEAIRTSAYDLQPEFDYVNGKQNLRDYVARNAVEVRVDDIARAGEILGLAVGSGATSVTGVRFDLKDRSASEKEALKRAVADARSRADAAAAGAGVTIDRVIRIEEQRAFVQEPRPMFAMRREAAMVADAGQPPITAGELEIRATVTMTSSIR
jgi:uncharacterized protein YggE